MSKGTSRPMTREAASRIASATSKNSGGAIPAGSFGSRADARVQRSQAAKQPPKAVKR